MDAFLAALLGCLGGEIGGKSQLLILALATRFRHDGAVIAGLTAASLANAVLGAAAGALIGPMLGNDARLLFLAIALLLLGLGMMWPVKPPDTLADWPTAAFFTTALGLFILGFGEGTQFLIAGLATRTGDPLMAGAGGVVGLVAALVPVVLLRDAFMQRVPVRFLRIASAVLMLLFAAITAISALHLT